MKNIKYDVKNFRGKISFRNGCIFEIKGNC